MIADLLPTPEQKQIEDSVSGIFARAMPLERFRDEAKGRARTELANWPMLVDAGLYGLGLDEASGGIGFGLPEEIVVARQMGRALVSPLVLATMIATHVAASAGNEDLRVRLMAGELRVAFANPASKGEVQLLDADNAELLLSWAGDAMVVYDRDNLTESRPVACMDETVSLSRGILSGVPIAADSSGGYLTRWTSLLIAAELAGIAERALDMAVDYAKIRTQFGQPIGAFQAIKHTCADMALRSEATLAQTYLAALDPAPDQVASARLLAGQAALANARANIQIHGGIGFTFEADAHRLLKRAHLFVVLGSSERKEMAAVLKGKSFNSGA